MSQDYRFYVIYDGYCNLCVTLVRLLEQIDQGKTFQYVPMQEEDTLHALDITPKDCEQGMILLETQEPFRRWQGSNAAEEIGRILPVAAPLVDAYRQVPGLKWMGDRLYEQIRDNRYTLFGGREALYQSSYPVCESDRCTPLRQE